MSEPKTENPILTERFDRAMMLALELHRTQVRKARGIGTPYACHLMTVTGMVLELGGNEDEACAAILHDSVEDQLPNLLKKAGWATDEFPTHAEREDAGLAFIGSTFGQRVREIVESLTDEKLAKEFKTLPRLQRIEFVKANRAKKIEKLKKADAQVRRVKACDTLHNLRSVLQEYRQAGPDVWLNFVGHRDGTIWYYEQMAELFYDFGPVIVGVEMKNAVERLKALVQDERWTA